MSVQAACSPNFVSTLPQWSAAGNDSDLAQQLHDQRLELAGHREEIQALRRQLDAQCQELASQRSLAKERWELTESLAKETMRGANNLCTSLIGALESRLQEMVRTEIRQAVAAFDSFQRDAVSYTLKREGALLEGAVKEAVSNAFRLQRDMGAQDLASTEAALLSRAGHERVCHVDGLPVAASTHCAPQDGPVVDGQDTGEDAATQVRAVVYQNESACISQEQHTPPEIPHQPSAEDSIKQLDTPEEPDTSDDRQSTSSWPFSGSVGSGVFDAVWALPQPRGHPPNSR